MRILFSVNASHGLSTSGRRGPHALRTSENLQDEERTVDFSFTEDQQTIRDAVLAHCSRFPDDYWLERDNNGVFPSDFHTSMAQAGWLGLAMPEAVGGVGLGITEAAIMMQAVAEAGGGI